MKNTPKNLESFESLKKIISDLKSSNGCPWNKAQTHQTLAQYAIEETYELIEVLEQKTINYDDLKDELGDLLLQVMLHCETAKLDNNFSINNVIANLSQKLIKRHPHVFSDTSVSTQEEVAKNWDNIKLSENPTPSSKKSLNSFNIIKSIPSLQVANKIGQKTKNYNFDWRNIDDVIKKVDEELLEVKEAIRSGTKNEQIHEIGDLLFSTAQLARHLKIDPEQSLRTANSRFENRFFSMKSLAKKQGLDFSTLTDQQLNNLWEEVKRRNKKI